MKRLSIEVQGKNSRWSFTFDGDLAYLEEWRADGLEVFEVINVIPAWVPAWAVKPWCFVQDVLYGGMLERKCH